MEEKQLEGLIKRSIRKLYNDDLFLIKNDVNERSISLKLASYIQYKINRLEKYWNVDCEYNRIGKDEIITKRFSNKDFITKAKELLGNSEETLTSTKAISIFPDINIHHRGLTGSENNLLVIEIKKEERLDLKNKFIKYDFLKLDQYCNELNYQFGVFLNINSIETTGFWWENGEKRENLITFYQKGTR